MKTSYAEANKRILKNILALYFRQIIIMFVTLFTSRVVLQTLGAEDFGIYNVVGGIVMMLTFLTGSLSIATQRFLSVELGKGDKVKLKQVFANSLSLHLILILFILILAETVGLWFLQIKMVIPPERINTAFWVYQFSVTSFVISVFFSPFLGAIKAHEKFGFYANISIFNVVMTLVITFLIVYLSYDKLFIYAFMVMCVIIIEKILVYIYCYRRFEECRIKFSIFKDSINDFMGYNTYTLLITLTGIAKTQGLNFVLNIYYGPIFGTVINAAQAIAAKINTALSSFSIDAISATAPQIIKSYAQNDRQRLWSLITQSSRLYSYLYLILSLPFFLEINITLDLWLGNGNYPQEHTAVFTRIILLRQLFWILIAPVIQANNATGKLRAYTINVSACGFLSIVFAIYIGMKGFSPAYIYLSDLIFTAVEVVISLIIVFKLRLQLSLYKYFTDVILPISKTGIFIISLPVAVHYYFSKTILSSCAVGIATLAWSMIIVYIVGLYKNEKQMIINKLPLFLRKRLNSLHGFS